MKKLSVYYEGWGERWLLGTLAHDRNQTLFEYSPEALRQQLELSPHQLPLQEQAYGDFPPYLAGLPGLIADALPDGWGLVVMDRWFRKNDVEVADVTALDRLSFLGHRTMGALTFLPDVGPELEKEEVWLIDLAKEAQLVLEDRETEALRKLALMGGSPHGARPKVLVHVNLEANTVCTVPTQGMTPWLVKFQAQGEHKEVCAIEELYATFARACGLEMPRTRHFDLSPKLAGFGIERFDCEQGMRVPVHTLAGFLHANFRVPQIDYVTFLRATRNLTRDEREVFKAFERAVFNVLFHNRDDHAKNFSFRLGHDRNWRLAPCYDLTYNTGPGGEHSMDVCGEARAVTRRHLLELANKADLSVKQAEDSIDRMLEVVGRFGGTAIHADIRSKTFKQINADISANATRLSN